MPYKRVGSRIYKKSGDGWKLKQAASSVHRAKKALNLLRAVEHGWTPSRRKTG